MLIAAALRQLRAGGAGLCYTAQNIAEFWNVCTRPRERNGFGFSIAESERHVQAIEGAFQFLPDSFEAYQEWRHSVVTHSIKGVKVHDARLAAILSANGVRRLLTFNTADFTRYSFLQILHPQDLISA